MYASASPEWELESLAQLREVCCDYVSIHKLTVLIQATFTCLPSLALTSDDIRCRLTGPLPDYLPRSLRKAACRYTVRRVPVVSVSMLRTDFVESGLGMDVLRIVLGRETALAR